MPLPDADEPPPTAAEVRREYAQGLASLTFNSRPVIMNLTHLAHKYSGHFAGDIIQCIEDRIKRAGPKEKLPCLYLLDSICKNHADPYRDLISRIIVSIFSYVFASLPDVPSRTALYKLRQTWNDVFGAQRLHMLDVRVKRDDPKWPVIPLPATVAAAADPETPSSPASNIHINPAVFGKKTTTPALDEELKKKADLIKQRELELMKLKEMKLEMELAQERKALQQAQAKQQEQDKPTKAKPPGSPSTSGSNKIEHTRKRSPSSSSSSAAANPPKKHHRDPRVRDKAQKDAQKSSSSSSSRKDASPAKFASKDHSSSSVDADKHASAPPPPSIRGDFKASKQPLKSSGDVKRGSSSSGGSSSSSKSSSGSSPKTNTQDLGGSLTKPPNKKSSSKKRKSDKVESPKAKQPRLPATSNEKEQQPQPTVAAAAAAPAVAPQTAKTQELELTPPSSSSPSPSPSPPPPPTADNSAATTTSSPKKKFKIPKMSANSNSKSITKRPASPAAGFKEEGPHVEFNKGQKMKNGAVASKQGKQEKRSKSKRQKMNLFGDDAPAKSQGRQQSQQQRQQQQPANLPSPSLGWAKFKETNPDEYHQPFNPQQQQQQQQQHGPPDAFGPNFNASTPVRGGHGGRFGRNNGPGGPFPGPQNNGPAPPFIPGVGGLLQQASNTDPNTVETQVIPAIIRQAQEVLQRNQMSQEQFSDLMKQVVILKEQTLIRQADRRVENKENNRGPPGRPDAWARPPPQMQRNMMAPPPAPGQRPMIPPPPFGQQPPMPFGHPPFRPEMFPPPGPSSYRDLPLANPNDLALCDDIYKSISIDNFAREIRYYGETATCVMGPDSVRELSFQSQQGQRRILIDGGAVIVSVQLNVPHYTDFFLDGERHRIKIGAPTRELWINGEWFECYFNTDIRVKIGRNLHTVHLEGPPPSVHIGNERPDLCAGFVNMILDGDPESQTRLYLDDKPQRLDIAGKPHVLRFVEDRTKLLINNHPYRTEFGGVPLIIYVNAQKHYVRLSNLPAKLRDAKPDQPGRTSPTQRNSSLSPPSQHSSSSPPSSSMTGSTSSSSQPTFERFDSVGQTGGFDSLCDNLFPSKSNHSARESDAGSEVDYKLDNLEDVKPAVDANSPATPSTPNSEINRLLANLHSSGLFKKDDNGHTTIIPGLEMIATPSTSSGKEGAKAAEDKATEESKAKEEKAAEEEQKQKEKEKAKLLEITPIDLGMPSKELGKLLKTRQAGVIDQLYCSAMQCKTCGVRYSSTNVGEYSRHLDWHFRMTRKEKENARKAKNRKWYFERQDWIVSEEIEDKVDQEGDASAPGGSGAANRAETPPPSVPVNEFDNSLNDNDAATKETGKCPICREDFDTFYKEDEDDGRWHYHNAIRGEDGRIFHPACHEDLKPGMDDSSALDTTADEEEMEASVEKAGEEEEKKDAAPEATATAASADGDVDMAEAEAASEDTANVKKEPVSPAKVEEAAAAATAAVKKEASPAPVEAQADVAKSEESESVAKAEDDKPEVAKTEVKTEPKTEDNSEKTSEEANVAKEEEEEKKPAAEAEVKSEAADAEVKTEAEDSAEANGETKAEDKAETEAAETSEKAEKKEDEKETSMLDDNAGAVGGNLQTVAASKPIKFNLTTTVIKPSELERRESIVSSEAEADDDSEFDKDAVIQEAKPDQPDLKPKLKGRKLMELPVQIKATEKSSLCSIM